MSSILPAAASPPTSNPAPPARLLHAARQFEALLLETLLGPVEKTFASVPGAEDPSAASYQSLGAEALASGLAGRGGLGIADLIVRSLMKGKEMPHHSDHSVPLKFGT